MLRIGRITPKLQFSKDTIGAQCRHDLWEFALNVKKLNDGWFCSAISIRVDRYGNVTLINCNPYGEGK